MFKRTDRLFSTEADALGFLNRVAPRLPIPKLIDSFQLDGASYAIFTKIAGTTLLELPDLDPDVFAAIRAALGTARRIVDVGAGAGSYEPTRP